MDHFKAKGLIGASPAHYNSSVCFVLCVLYFESNESDLPFVAIGSDLKIHPLPLILILHFSTLRAAVSKLRQFHV